MFLWFKEEMGCQDTWAPSQALNKQHKPLWLSSSGYEIRRHLPPGEGGLAGEQLQRTSEGKNVYKEDIKLLLLLCNEYHYSLYEYDRALSNLD